MDIHACDYRLRTLPEMIGLLITLLLLPSGQTEHHDGKATSSRFVVSHNPLAYIVHAARYDPLLHS